MEEIIFTNRLLKKLGQTAAVVTRAKQREQEALQNGANQLITPFAPFVLSEAFLSSEIEQLNLGFLNPRSSNLRTSAGNMNCQVVFVQLDQLEEFFKIHLRRFENPITLITGKWHLPGLELNRYIDLILSSGKVRRWFSQNQVYSFLPISPFPYGVSLWTTPQLLKIRSHPLRSRTRKIYVPHSRVHSHLEDKPRELRESLFPRMDRELPLRKYLRRIASSDFVVCPPGDRLDTYRHWEALALGAVPVCAENEYYWRLFGDCAVQVSPWEFEAVNGLVGTGHWFPDPTYASLARLRALVFETPLSHE